APHGPRALPRRRQSLRVSVPPGELLVETLTLGRGGAAAGADPAGLAADWATVSARGLDRLVTFEGCALWLWRRLRELGAAAAPPAASADWRAREAWDLLSRAGYERTPPNGRGEGHFHLPPLWDAQRVAVELHTSTSEAVAPAEAWRRATTGGRAVERAGVQVALPAPTELLW